MIVHDMPNQDYHAHPTLSSSQAKRILPPSTPAQFQWERINGRPWKKEYDFGTAAHTLLLGKGDAITVVDADAWRTNAAKERRAEAEAAGGVALLTKDYETAKKMAAAARHNPLVDRLFSDGDAEVSLFYPDLETGVELRARVDYLPKADSDGLMVVPDYKTGKTAAPSKVGGAVADYGYNMSAAWYSDAIIALGLAERVEFLLVFQEKHPPFLTSVVRMDEFTMRVGRVKNRRAIDLFHRCTLYNDWPGYPQQPVEVSLPYWARLEGEAILEGEV